MHGDIWPFDGDYQVLPICGGDEPGTLRVLELRPSAYAWFTVFSLY
ncbi:hypothetical protein NKI95_32300 [Mesorhizobium sp. M0306]